MSISQFTKINLSLMTAASWQHVFTPFFLSPSISVNQISITQQIFTYPITRSPENHTILHGKLSDQNTQKRWVQGETARGSAPGPSPMVEAAGVHRPTAPGRPGEVGTVNLAFQMQHYLQPKGTRQQCWWDPEPGTLDDAIITQGSLSRAASHIRDISSTKVPVTPEAPAVMTMYQGTPQGQ